jgi:hypothetical protein
MQKSEKILTAILILALLIINVVIVWPLFLGEYDANMASIGIAHILNAQFISRFWTIGWNPFWYGGFPNHLIYPLLAPIFLALVQKIFSFLTIAQVYRIVVALAYITIPISSFFLVRYMSKSNIAAFFAAFIFILVPSANYFLIPGFIGMAHYSPWQLSVIVDYGEGPHMIALAIVPLAIIVYWRLLRQPTLGKFILSAVLIGLIISINLFSAYALAYFLLGVFFSEFVLGQGKQKFLISLLLAPAIYGLIAFCYDYSMLLSLSKSGYIHPENIFRLPPITTLFLIIIFTLVPIIIVYEVFKEKPKLQNGLVLGIWFFIFWAIPYAFYRGLWFGSQPNRYMPELNLTAAIIVGFLISVIFNFLRNRFNRVGIYLGTVFLILVLSFFIYVSHDFIQNGYKLVTANPDISQTSEYRIAKWLGEHIDYQKGERAFLSGSPAFFLNEFVDVPQLRGDEDNAQADPWWADVVYQVNRGENGELAIGWLQTYNVKYAVIPITASTPYQDIINQERFANLNKVAEIDGFYIYEIPGEKNLIQAVNAKKLLSLYPFKNKTKAVLDMEGLKKYLAALSEPQTVKVGYSYLYRKNPDLVKIKVEAATSETGILFKSTFNSGWKAKFKMANGKWQMADIVKVGPDLMLAKDLPAGNYTLELSYHRPLVEYLGYLTTVVTIVILGVLVIIRKNEKIL